MANRAPRGFWTDVEKKRAAATLRDMSNHSQEWKSWATENMQKQDPEGDWHVMSYQTARNALKEHYPSAIRAHGSGGKKKRPMLAPDAYHIEGVESWNKKQCEGRLKQLKEDLSGLDGLKDRKRELEQELREINKRIDDAASEREGLDRQLVQIKARLFDLM